MKRAGVLVGLCAGFLWVQAGIAADRIAFGTTQVSSIHYTYGVAAAKSINQVSGDKVDLTVISTAGGSDNLERLRRGQLNMGISGVAVAFQSYSGLDAYKDSPLPDLRMLWAYSAARQFFVVREDSGVKTLAGLQGKKFTAGHRGSSTESMGMQIFKILGIEPDYFRGNLESAVAAVKDGRSIGYTKVGLYGLDSTTLELRALTPIRMLSFSDEEVRKIRAAVPYMSFDRIKAGEMDGVNYELVVPAQYVATFATARSLTEDQAKAIVLGAIKSRDQQAAAVPDTPKDLGEITIKTAVDMGMPLHAGAVSALRQLGYNVPAKIIPPEMKK